MLDHPTLDQLKALRLDGMAAAFTELQAQDAAGDLTHAEWLALLIDREVVSRNTRRFETRMRAARLRHAGAAIEASTIARPASSTRRCSRGWRRRDGSPRDATF